MYKLIACDLDETLIKPDRTIDSRDIEAIKKLKDLGVKFVLATGRGYNTVQGTLKELDLFDEFIEQGIERGKLEEASIIAKNILDDGFPIGNICKTTGLTKEEILKL